MAERWSNKPLTQQVWEQRAQAKWGDAFDYSESVYINANAPIVIRCKKHDLRFVVMAGNHIASFTQGSHNVGGCPLCGYENQIEWRRKEEELRKVKIRKAQEEKVIGLLSCTDKLGRVNANRKLRYANSEISIKQANFIKKVKAKYGDLYILEKVRYVDRETPVTLTCRKHGDFSITPHILLGGNYGRNPHGCPICDGIKQFAKPLTAEYFFSKMKEFFGNRYDFSSSVYKSKNSKVSFVCPKHGKQARVAETLLKGKGCPECEREERENKWLEKIREVHGDKYQYPEKPKNLSLSSKIRIICPIHGEFRQGLLEHIYQGCGCPKCVGTRVLSRIERQKNFIKRSKERYGDRFDYSKVNYKNEGTPVLVRCKEHDYWFEILPDTHVRRGDGGCPLCSGSTGEMEVRKWLDEAKVEYVTQYPIENINPDLHQSCLIVDFYLPIQNMFVEYNGQQHYENIEGFYKRSSKTFEEQQLRDKTLRIYCEIHEIRLLEIPYWDFENIDRILSESLSV